MINISIISAQFKTEVNETLEEYDVCGYVESGHHVYVMHSILDVVCTAEQCCCSLRLKLFKIPLVH